MTANLQELQAISNPQSISKYRGLGTLAVLGVVVLYWCQLFYQLQVEWTANAQYNYGWFVPLLAAVLLWRRWADRPEDSGPWSVVRGPRSSVLGPWSVVSGRRSLDSRQSSVVRGPCSCFQLSGFIPHASRRFLLSAFCFLLCLLLLPLRIIHESNVGWRSAQWLHALILVALTLMLLWRAGGWRWVRHFGFPVLFLLVAVPWPMRLESYLVQDLMRLVAAVTVEVVGVFGVPAMQRGNLLEIGSGVVSIDGACSGVRSLQTSLMLALFLGEMYRLRYWGRLALVPASLLIAFVANVGRTSFLTWSAAKLGMARMESLHSSAGVAVVVLVFGLLWLSARFLARRPLLNYQPSTLNSPPPPPDPPATDFSPQLSSFIPANDHRLLITDHRSLFTLPYLLSALSWLLCIEATAAVWFHFGDKRAVTNPTWSVNWPTGAPGYQEAQISKVASDMLRYDTAKSVTWQDEAGNRWGFMALRWGPDNKNSFVGGRNHTPDQCFAGAGWKLVSEPAPARVTVNGIELPFRRYVFEQGGLTEYAFLTLWDERSPGGLQETPFAYGIARRLKAAAEGKRHQGLKKLEISVIGPTSPDDALGLLKQKLGEMIVPEKQKLAR